MILYDKFFCKHCEKVFDSKNKFYEHLRSREYQKSISSFIIKSIATHKSNLTSLSVFEIIFNDANIAFKKAGIKYFTHIIIALIFAAKNITSHKFNLSALIFTESIILKALSSTSLSVYRAMLSLLFIYKFYKKLYFIIADLYMRYILLSKFIIIRIMIVLFIIFI